MRTRHLLPVEADPAAVLAVLPAALDGSGPALAPLPDGPAAVRRALVAALEPAVPLERADTALVVPTSGSTGRPKASLLGAAALGASATGTRARLGDGGRWVLALPVTHVAGLMVLVRSVLAGTAPALVDLSGGFRPDRFDAARPAAGEGPLLTALVPTQLVRLLDAGIDLRRFDAVLLGGSAAPAGLLDRAAEQGVRVVRSYGMTETCGGCVYDGRPLPEVDVTLTGVGGIRIAGPVLFSGYRLRPDLTEQALDDEGRLVTRDLGRLDADGRLVVVGRLDDTAVTGGVTVSLTEVEHALGEHPAVRACAVVSVPDDLWGERLVAVVEAAPGPAPTLEELRSFLAVRLVPPALPRAVVLVPALPVLASGKPDLVALRTLVAAAPH